MPLRHLKLAPQNRYEKMRYLRAMEALPSVAPLPDPARVRRIHANLIDDLLTTPAVESVKDVQFITNPVDEGAMRVWPHCMLDNTSYFLGMMQAKNIEGMQLLPAFPTSPIPLPLPSYRPTSWDDPEAWTFNNHGNARRVALGACLAPTTSSPAATVPIAFAPCSGRLFHVAKAIAAAPKGVVFQATAASTAIIERYLVPVEALVLYNPGA